MDRYIMISSDCHAAAPWPVARGYLDPAFRDDFDRWVAARSEGFKPFDPLDPLGRFPPTDPLRPMTDPLGQADRTRIMAEPAVKEGGLNGAWDPDIRHRELDREGIAAEIVFVDGQNRNGMPFGGLGTSYSFEHHWAARRGHNRWLAELCATAPARHYGVAEVLLKDVEMAVTEIRWARKAGLIGGVGFRAVPMLNNDPEAFLFHPRYEPIWSTCEELAMPLQLHVGSDMPNYGVNPGSRWILSTEAHWTTHRTVWHLIWGGVLERHPGLRVCVTEAGGSNWVEPVLEVMDTQYNIRNPEATHALLALKPSEYWRRQCGVGVSNPPGQTTVEHRGAVGLETIMWGSDYPHHEGTWPRSMQRLKQLFAGVPVAEVRKMVGENAARICGIDLKKLEPIAARIGPSITEFGAETSADGSQYANVAGRAG